MTRVGSFKLAVRCAYCPATVHIDAGDVSITQRTEQIGKTIKCDACGSGFTLWITTKRASKGKRIKEAEAKQKAAHAAKVEEAVKRNDEIAARLLAEPGCKCAEYAAGPKAHLSWRDDRRDGLQSGGTTNGIPNEPRHRYDCPAAKKR